MQMFYCRGLQRAPIETQSHEGAAAGCALCSVTKLAYGCQARGLLILRNDATLAQSVRVTFARHAQSIVGATPSHADCEPASS